MRRLLSTRAFRQTVSAGSALVALGLTALAVRHFATSGWPLSHGDMRMVAVAGFLFVLAYGLKAYGWQRLFAAHERPQGLALAAAGGAASLTGAALPGRFDDVVRVAVVRRYPGRRPAVTKVFLSLFLLALIDTAALSPLASTAAAVSARSAPIRAGLALVALAGLAAAALVLVLPRLTNSGRLLRFRATRWLGGHVTLPREAVKAWALVLASWLARGLALVVLLGALGFGLSFSLAIGFLCAGAASAALPVAPAGAATQAGAGAGMLVASGVHASQAVAFALTAQALFILAGAGVCVLAGLWQVGRRLAGARAAS